MNTDKITQGFNLVRNEIQSDQNCRYTAIEATLASLWLYILTDCKDRAFLKDAIHFLGQEEYDTRVD